MLKLLFILSMIAIPFNDFFPVLPIGELQDELSVYLFLATMVVFFMSLAKPATQMAFQNIEPQAITHPFKKIVFFMYSAILVSFFMNLNSMFGGIQHGRYPLEKFLTSTGTVTYGFMLAYMTFAMSRHYKWHDIIFWPIAVSIGITSFFAVLEVLAWAGGPFASFYVIVTQMTHLGFDFTGGKLGESMADWLLVGRARSICFEPPSLANFASFAWPWAFAGISSTANNKRFIYIFLWIMCTVLILLANSRTSMLLLPTNFFILFLLKKIYLSPVPCTKFARQITTISLIAFSIALIVAFFVFADDITTYVINGDSVSNITRFSSMTAGFNEFLKNPVWGYGFGQFGFHVLENMPQWGYYSWEIKFWLSRYDFSFWPPVFSIFARFAAEMGIIGVVVWTGIWIQLARVIWRVTFAYQLKTGKVLPMAYPLIISCYCTLLSGIALDSLRTPMIWIGLGLSCSYIYDVRLRLSHLQRQENQTREALPTETAPA